MHFSEVIETFSTIQESTYNKMEVIAISAKCSNYILPSGQITEHLVWTYYCHLKYACKMFNTVVLLNSIHEYKFLVNNVTQATISLGGCCQGGWFAPGVSSTPILLITPQRAIICQLFFSEQAGEKLKNYVVFNKDTCTGTILDSLCMLLRMLCMPSLILGFPTIMFDCLQRRRPAPYMTSVST